MTPGKLSKRVIVDRLAWIERMVKEIRALPLDDRSSFLSRGQPRRVTGDLPHRDYRYRAGNAGLP